MLPTSLPGAIFGGITAARPTSPRAARRASVGISAASSGVRPSSASRGSSAQPSGTQITYFTGSVSQVTLRRGLARTPHRAAAVPVVVRVDQAVDRPVAVVVGLVAGHDGV